MLKSMGLQRVRHNLVTETQQQWINGLSTVTDITKERQSDSVCPQWRNILLYQKEKGEP